MQYKLKSSITRLYIRHTSQMEKYDKDRHIDQRMLQHLVQQDPASLVTIPCPLAK